MQFLKHLVYLLFLCSISLTAQTDILYTVEDDAEANAVLVHSFTDEEVIPRIQNIQSAIATRYTDAVKSYIRTYTVKKREKTEAILGKSVMYFPIYEEQFRQKGMPESLKYLSVTESALNPIAISSASAVGLWQFMKETGKEYGLRIDQTVDERSDPYLSTAAAAEYLQKQYNRFGDWALAIAAYNSGPGNVSKAIKRGRSTNFWTIAKYLPKETRSYVPGYIAAAYILQHYEKHGLIPQYPEMDLQLTEAIKVYEFMNFQTISAMTGVSMETLRALNPSFLQNYIPATQRGYFLILPKRVMNQFKNSMATRPDTRPIYQPDVTPIYVSNTSAGFADDNYFTSYHTVQRGDNLLSIAKLFNCHPYHLKAWNDLKSNYVNEGQQLKIYMPTSERPKPVVAIEPVVPRERREVPAILPIEIASAVSIQPSEIAKENVDKTKQYEYHIIHRNESLRDIAIQYGTTVEKILEYNGVTNGRLPMPGDKIKVKIVVE